MTEGDHSIERHYDALASYWKEITQGPGKDQVLWPVVRSLLPELPGKRVLEAGCGDGTYSAWLADRGAEVLGIDLSQEMIDVAQRQHGDELEFRQADVEESLSFVDNQHFDLVLCQHMFSHLSELTPTLNEFARVLKPDGTMVLSTHHPFHDFLVVYRQEYPDVGEVDEMNLEPVVSPAVDTSIYQKTERYEIY